MRLNTDWSFMNSIISQQLASSEQEGFWLTWALTRSPGTALENSAVDIWGWEDWLLVGPCGISFGVIFLRLWPKLCSFGCSKNYWINKANFCRIYNLLNPSTQYPLLVESLTQCLYYLCSLRPKWQGRCWWLWGSYVHDLNKWREVGTRHCTRRPNHHS